jgi:hypothetical protein
VTNPTPPQRVPENGIAVERVDGTWRVAGQESDSLLSAMVLSDLLAAESGHLSLAARPERGQLAGDEVTRLQLTVGQLERALSARVLIEQAIGVVAERRRISPRQAFEQLRGVARGSGRKVHDLAGEVVRSATSPAAARDLPSGLRRPESAERPAVPSPAVVARAVTSR